MKNGLVEYAVKSALLSVAGKEIRLGDISTSNEISEKTKQRILRRMVELGYLEKQRGQKNYKPTMKAVEELTVNLITKDEWKSFLENILTAIFKPADKNNFIEAMKELLKDLGEI